METQDNQISNNDFSRFGEEILGIEELLNIRG